MGAVAGNRQHTSCYLNSRCLFCIRESKVATGIQVATFSPLASVNNPLFFFSFKNYLKFLLFYCLLAFSFFCHNFLFSSLTSFIVILAGFLEWKGTKTHGPVITQNGYPGKLLHTGNLPHTVLYCAVKQVAPLPCSWKINSNPNKSGIQCFPFGI